MSLSYEALPGQLSPLFESIEDLVKECSETAIRKVAKVLEDKIRANIGLTDHTLLELEKLGHPYSLTNIGSDIAGTSSTGVLGHGPFQVHIQRNVIRGSGGGPGVLVDVLGTDFKNLKEQFVAIVGIEETSAAHVRWVVLGTRFMVARDFFAGTFLEVVEDLFDIFERETQFRRVFVDFSLF